MVKYTSIEQVEREAERLHGVHQASVRKRTDEAVERRRVIEAECNHEYQVINHRLFCKDCGHENRGC